jgi:hypothetical protein
MKGVASSFLVGLVWMALPTFSTSWKPGARHWKRLFDTGIREKGCDRLTMMSSSSVPYVLDCTDQVSILTSRNSGYVGQVVFLSCGFCISALGDTAHLDLIGLLF